MQFFLDKYFLPVIAYLLFSICDFLGRVLSDLIKLVINNLNHIIYTILNISICLLLYK